MQYVNYSNITLKGPGGAAKNQFDKAVVSDIETRINEEILRCPECGRCSACTEKTTRRKLCKDRLEVRDRLIASLCKKAPPSGPEKGKKTSKKRKAEPPTNSSKKPPPSTTASAAKSAAAVASKAAASGKKSPKLMMKKANGQLKPRITSNGNKRMAIPDDLFPEFCKRIGAHGTGERVNVINQFVEDHPTISIRQVTIRLSEITTRDRPTWIPEPEKKQGRAFMVSEESVLQCCSWNFHGGKSSHWIFRLSSSISALASTSTYLQRFDRKAGKLLPRKTNENGKKKSWRLHLKRSGRMKR